MNLQNGAFALLGFRGRSRIEDRPDGWLMLAVDRVQGEHTE